MSKTFIGSLFILLIGAIGFFGLNYYEQSNNCSFSISMECISNTEAVYHPKCSGMFCPKPYSISIDKPLILLYPENNMPVEISLEFKGQLLSSFPEYSHTGWSVIAYPDGTLKHALTQQETYGLFWEGTLSDDHYDISHGFTIKGSDIREFLYKKLTEIGLNTKEKSDFIMYWYPKLQNYPYIQITFAGEDYTNIAKLQISPTPNSLLRVFMVARPLKKYEIIPEQVFTKFERKGFSVVEWGGTIIE